MEELLFKIAENGMLAMVLAWALWRLQDTSKRLHTTLIEIIKNNTQAMNTLSNELSKRPCLKDK